jgi:hypothetical protein
MPQKITIEADYAASADAVWASVLQYQALSAAMAGEAEYFGLPQGEAKIGDDFDVVVKFSDWRPNQRWHIRIIGRDDTARVLQSHEHGDLVRSWRHTLTVTPTGPCACRYRDEVAIEAGLLTPLVAMTARRMYEKRHLMRRRLVEGRD